MPVPTPTAQIRSLQDTFPPPPAGFRMTSHAVQSYDAFRAAGWTDSQLLQHGYMAHAEQSLPPPAPPSVLTMETLRQHLCERCPGFTTTAAVALGLDAKEFLRRVEIEGVEINDLLIARAGPPTRPTQLGDLPICADSIDRLDKALSDRDEAYSRELSRLREIAGPKLHAAYRELAGLKVLRRLLDSQEGATLKARLHALNAMLDGERDDY